MRLVDANVLLYAVDQRAQWHDVARGWLDTALNGRETILLPWASLLAFVRISTHPAVYPDPLPPDTALGVVEGWLASPVAVVPEPDHAHARRMREALGALGRGGNLVTDGHLAALALQYGATVVTFDNDFGRFEGVRWQRPVDRLPA